MSGSRTERATLLRAAPFLVIAALLTQRIVGLIYAGRTDAVDWSMRVTTGDTVWQQFQSRLLMPWLVKGCMAVTGAPQAVAYPAVCVATLVVTYLGAYWVFLRIGGTGLAAACYTAVLAGLFLGLQDESYLYLWDYAELPLMLALWYGVAARKPVRYFVLWFPLALGNRESGLFFPAWVALDAVEFRPGRGRWWWPRRVRWGQAALGVALVLAGIATTWGLREGLYLGSAQPTVSGEGRGSQHLQLGNNLAALLDPALSVYFLLGVWGLLAYRLREWFASDRFGALLLLFAQLGTCLAFGVVPETRVFLGLLPGILVCDALARFAGRASERQVEPQPPGSAEAGPKDGIIEAT